MNYFVTAISTDSGKTVLSAILTQALQADYWKPVQSGAPSDTETVRRLISNSKTIFHPESYFLQKPASPHASAKAEGIEIQLDKIKIPETKNHLVIEGAGGVLVPLNDTDFVIDIAQNIACEIILVSNIYLGNINHTLLTINELKRRNLNVKGIIFNGNSNPETERIILHHSGYDCLLRMQPEAEITPEIIGKYAEKLRAKL